MICKNCGKEFDESISEICPHCGTINGSVDISSTLAVGTGTICKNCGKEFNSKLSGGICPHCGTIDEVVQDLPSKIIVEGTIVRCEKCGNAYDTRMNGGICPNCGTIDEIVQDLPSKIIVEGTIVMCDKCGNAYDTRMNGGICPHCGNGEPKKIKKKYDPKWLQVGTILHGRYEIDSVLGAGGFGITYKALDKNTGIYRAVKEYFQNGVVNRVPGDPTVIIASPKNREEFEYGKERLLREAKVVASFHSSSIVNVVDFFEENNTSYMVMEYLDQSTLQEKLLNKELYDWNTIIKIGNNIANALEEVHAANVVHRDIAPDNIMIDDQNKVKIIDFGSARLSEKDTEEKLLVFKPGYAPPEQYENIDLSNDKQKGWVDVYALGATLYSLLTGVIPIESTDRKIEADKGQDPLEEPIKINQNIPQSLNNAIMRAMALNIHERYQTITEFKDALNSDKVVKSLQVIRKEKRRKRLVGILAGFFIAIGIGMYALNNYQSKRDAFEFLDPTTVNIWYVDDGTGKVQMINTLKDNLKKSDTFEQVNINLQGFSEDEYENKLEEAYKEGKMPSIFEYVGQGSFMGKTENIQDLTDSLNKVRMKKHFMPNTLSTGINIPVIYARYSVVKDKDMTIGKFKDLESLCNINAMAINPNVISQYELMFKSFKERENDINLTLEDFLNGDAAIYISDTSECNYIFSSSNTAAAKYIMIPLSVSTIQCTFTNTWAMNDCNEAEEAAAKAVMKYLLTNTTQVSGYVENGINGIPLEEETIKEFKENRAIYEKFDIDYDRYTIYWKE